MSATTERLDALQSSLPRTALAGRLTFNEKCAAYYLLLRGFKKSLVALTFGVTPSAMTRLAQARSARYADVVREYRRLGHEAFGDRYFTQDMEARFLRYQAAIPNQSDKAKRKFGPNPNARSAAGEYLIRSVTGPETIFFVFWLEGESWTYRQDEEPGAFVSAKRFDTSSEARNAAFDSYAITKEEVLRFVREEP